VSMRQRQSNYEDTEAVYVEALAPGIDPSSLHLHVQGNTLSMTGEKRRVAGQTPPRHPLRQCIIKLTGYSREISSLGSSPVLPYARPMYYIV
jgi:HSP20 family molecular chaperone IbpA